jgi:hypothetical protein
VLVNGAKVPSPTTLGATVVTVGATVVTVGATVVTVGATVVLINGANVMFISGANVVTVGVASTVKRVVGELEKLYEFPVHVPPVGLSRPYAYILKSP